MPIPIFHHQPPHRDKVGQEVLDLANEPWFGGWAPFVHEKAIMQENENGIWEVQFSRLTRVITSLAADINRAGTLQLDCEPPLADHASLHLYMEATLHVDNLFQELSLDSVWGWFRIPDHVSDDEHPGEISNVKFAMTPVLRHTTAVFITIKNSDQRWESHCEDVLSVAPHHVPVVKLDAYHRRGNNAGQAIAKADLLRQVELAHRKFKDVRIVFRQEGPHVAQGMRWVAEWLGW